MLYQENLLALIASYKGGPFQASESRAGNWLQYIIKDAQAGMVQIELTVLDQHCNPWKQIHGGVTALVMDEIIGLTFLTVSNGELYTTVNLNTEYLKPGLLGDVLIAEGKVIKHGKRIAYAEGTIYNHKKEIIARATSNLLNTGNLIFEQ